MDKNEQQDTNKPITFVLSDESVNSHGNVVLTEGIDTTAFERNPVMLYMHNRDGNVIGRWENIRKEDKRLLGDAVFDDSTELAATVKKQVEKGFLRSVSIGIEVITIEDLNGVQTIVKSRLIEVSIVDIPSNKNAVKLCRRSGGYAYNLKELENDNTPEDLKAALIALLGLESGADDKDIIEAVKMALEGKETPEEAVDEAITNGYIDGAQRGTFIALARGNRGAFRDFINGQRKAQAPEISRLINDAVNKRKLLGCETAIFERLGAKIGAKALDELLFTLRPMPKPMEFIKGGAAHSNRSQWKLDDYRKFAPQELERDPELYARLVRAEKGEDITAHSLDWYRRNNPEFLREHPEVFRELLEQAKKRQREEARKNKK
ncbi:MAG: HK97 family phage prohead protease [Muribaculaceae bacterium]|nr:HK97 family phage prohead protease [Muribaculaceae bacterium]